MLQEIKNAFIIPLSFVSRSGPLRSQARRIKIGVNVHSRLRTTVENLRASFKGILPGVHPT